MDTFELIKGAVEDFKPLHDRMDADKNLYTMLEYQLLDIKTGKPAKNVVNVTLNDPKVFANRCMSFMSEATMQAVCEGKTLQDRDTSLIENFDSDIRYEIDQQLMVREIPGLYNFLIEQSLVRGTDAARFLFWEDEGKLVPDLLPCDSRYLLYEYGRKDLGWGAFQTTRSVASIKEEYPQANIPSNAKKGAIWEHWNEEQGEIWLSAPGVTSETKGQKLHELENKFKYVPFIIQPVGAGSMLQDEGSIKYRGESIFADNRIIYPQLNMMASVLQTLNYLTFNRVFLWESEAGTGAEKPPEPGVRSTIPIDKGTRGLFPSEVADIGQATRLFYALLLGAIQRGSLPNIDYGNLTFPLSAVAISRLTSTKDAIFAPRLQAIAWFYRKLHYMIKDQYIKGGYQAELGEEGMKRAYNTSGINKEYRMVYKFHAVSPEQDIANYAIAQQAMAIGMSQHTVFTNILKLDNPAGEIMKGRAERAEKLDPIIAQFRYAHSLVDQGTEESFLEADLAIDSVEAMLKQRYSPVEARSATPTKEVTQGMKAPQGLVPLLEGGGGGRGLTREQEETEMATVMPEELLRREERRGEVVRKSEEQG